ncbi:hypothetical protein RF007C_02080 [Ruminococcus flavefaciens 007c]|uniref:Fibronectin type-III domain-containing protein n=1 Tax=Ruminococcus flavefaciens 007c TaxID=1341157 RepID=W7UAV5_RUMFL|nr:hypothetical protein RF007C_02080 [Ruminococcus flavefaciens 007c]
MGSTCHYNYIHITDDGSYSLQKPGDPGNISAVRDGENVAVSFEAPANPDNVTINGYKVTALADDGTRVRASGTESPIIFEDVDKSKNYTISIVTLSNAGKSDGAGSYVLEADAESAPETTTVNEEAATTVSTTVTQTSQRSSETTSSTTKKQDSNNSPKTGVPLPAGAAALLISSLGIALLSRKKSDTE